MRRGRGWKGGGTPRSKLNEPAVSPRVSSANKTTVLTSRFHLESLSPPRKETANRLESEDLVLLRERSLSMMVKAREIAAIESQGDYTRIFLSEEKILLMKKPLSFWESQLPAELFTKVSRSLLVNKKSVAKMERKNLLSWDLYLEGAKEPITLSSLESKRLRQVIS